MSTLVQRYEVALRSLLGAVEVMEDAAPRGRMPVNRGRTEKHGS